MIALKQANRRQAPQLSSPGGGVVWSLTKPRTVPYNVLPYGFMWTKNNLDGTSMGTCPGSELGTGH